LAVREAIVRPHSGRMLRSLAATTTRFHVRDDRETPLCTKRVANRMRLILVERQARYFLYRVWTRVSELITRLNLVFARKGICAANGLRNRQEDRNRTHGARQANHHGTARSVDRDLTTLVSSPRGERMVSVIFTTETRPLLVDLGRLLVGSKAVALWQRAFCSCSGTAYSRLRAQSCCSTSRPSGGWPFLHTQFEYPGEPQCEGAAALLSRER
jgi:hypothetical protein